TSAYDVVLQRDPLQPLINDAGQVINAQGLRGGIAVQGIVWAQERPLALIDDELVGAGDHIGPFEVVKIEADQLLLRRGEQTIRIPLDPSVPVSDWPGPLRDSSSAEAATPSAPTANPDTHTEPAAKP